jgi:hypothetical protein
LEHPPSRNQESLLPRRGLSFFFGFVTIGLLMDIGENVLFAQNSKMAVNEFPIGGVTEDSDF